MGGLAKEMVTGWRAKGCFGDWGGEDVSEKMSRADLDRWIMDV